MEDEGTRRGPSAALSLQSGTTSFMLPAMGESLLKSRQTTSPQPGRLKTALKVLLVARRAIDPLTISSMMQNKIRLRIFYWTKQYYASAIKALEVDSSTSPPAAVKAGLRRYAIKQAQKQLLDSWGNDSGPSGNFCRYFKPGWHRRVWRGRSCMCGVVVPACELQVYRRERSRDCHRA